ncbi:hypothetical protein FOA43_000626 [Brettanomyces nanus]|uniref:Uncharacterized protein n=1 Tax=Eeniella nana TaxID=13502 RepID=A0A875RWN3_EENNA|nr:uncharacterized protein FOA43_000626 [Brettanomyces nanus]QPG73316.1 hypothetical protein FOA43_000626 [Brettanomyces nanus]
MQKGSNALKISVVGDLGTGKSSLVLRFVQSSFSDALDPSLEDNYLGVADLDNGERYKLDILDTVDDELSDDLEEVIKLSDSDVIILTYSISEDASYNNLFLRCSRFRTRKEKIRKNGTLPKTLIVGTKSDLEDHRQVPRSSGEKLMKAFGLNGFIECSSKSGYNVDEAFKIAAQLALEKRLEQGISIDAVYQDRSGTTVDRKEGSEFDTDKDPSSQENECIGDKDPAHLNSLSATLQSGRRNDQSTGSLEDAAKSKPEHESSCCVIM